MNNLKLAVHWFKERADDNDDNDGYHFGIYTFNCTKEDFDPEAGYGSYDVLDAEWFKTEAERDKVLMLEVLEAELVADALQGDTTVLAELLKSVPDHIIYASLSDKAQEDFEPIPTDGTTVELDTDEYVEVRANNLSIIIKHNDVGVSVDYSEKDGDGIPFREDQCWWEDVPEPVYYQPLLSDEEWYENKWFNTFDVYRSFENAKKAFPNNEIGTYSGDDIEDPNYLD